MRIMFLARGFNMFGRRHVLLLPIWDLDQSEDGYKSSTLVQHLIGPAVNLGRLTDTLELCSDTARKQISKVSLVSKSSMSK